MRLLHSQKIRPFRQFLFHRIQEFLIFGLQLLFFTVVGLLAFSQESVAPFMMVSFFILVDLVLRQTALKLKLFLELPNCELQEFILSFCVHKLIIQKVPLLLVDDALSLLVLDLIRQFDLLSFHLDLLVPDGDDGLLEVYDFLVLNCGVI
jgi:hypothetical protein